MEQLELRIALEGLVKEALEHIRELGKTTSELRGVALYDERKDEHFTSRPSFADAETALKGHSLVVDRYGANESKRIALQFVYEYLARVGDPTFAEPAFEDVWDRFWRELQIREWVHVGIANLKNFASSSPYIDLGDGVSIRHRSKAELISLFGWTEFHWEQLATDWSDGSAGQHILVIEHREPKVPERLIHGDLFTPSVKADATLLALRLHAEGDVHIGRLFYSRPALFNVGRGGLSSTGWSIWSPGWPYTLEEADVAAVRELRRLVAELESAHADGWRNVAFALRSFTSIYNRLSQQADDQVLDSITTLEALLGDSAAELTFKLSFRTASLLARSDDERMRIFGEMRSYYSTRSRIVHGLERKPVDTQTIQDNRPLRRLARQVLVAYLHLANSRTYENAQALQRVLDADLLHAGRRDALRALAAL